MSHRQTRVPLSRRFPWLRPLAMRVHRTRRSLRWYVDSARGRVRWAAQPSGEQLTPLPVVVKKHASPLLRLLTPSEMALQHGKVTNLALAAARTNGLTLHPGESFSFNRVVGEATTRRGFTDGMRITDGKPSAGVGGGLCQLANLLHWLTLHSALTVVERSEHSVDLFPDTERTVPWGVGCTIVYNYVDLVIRNDTADDFCFHTWLDETHLIGELRASRAQPVWTVEARAEAFVSEGEDVVRRNELWRVRADGDQELIRRNRATVAYPVAPERLLT